jgi:hypothetical protein
MGGLIIVLLSVSPSGSIPRFWLNTSECSSFGKGSIWRLRWRMASRSFRRLAKERRHFQETTCSRNCRERFQLRLDAAKESRFPGCGGAYGRVFTAFANWVFPPWTAISVLNTWLPKAFSTFFFEASNIPYAPRNPGTGSLANTRPNETSLIFATSEIQPHRCILDGHFRDGRLWSKICGQTGTGTLLRVVNPPPFFRSSTEARTPQKDRDRDRRQRELTFDPRQTLVSLSDSPRLTTKFHH